MSVGRFLQQAAAGNAGEAVYVDDVFSTYLYQGTGSAQTITNGIDLDGEGGLVWIKNRDQSAGNAQEHILSDTERGVNKHLSTNNTGAEESATRITAFNTNGFSVSNSTATGYSGWDYTSWTFRKQPGFFDIVTYTGNGTNRTINHNLGSTPGMIIIKCTSGAFSWAVWHRGINTDSRQYLWLNSTQAVASRADYWNTSDPTDSFFPLGTNGTVNSNGQTYVAYLFAHDAQDFGTNSDESIIKCGTYTGNGSATGVEVDFGFEPQWLLVKTASGSGTHKNWWLLDNMRGIPTGSNENLLAANLSDAETTGADICDLTASGFIAKNSSQANQNGMNYIYVAIRRPHKPAEEFAATDLFSAQEITGNGSSITVTTGFPVDLTFSKGFSAGTSWWWVDRLRGESKYISSNNTSAESTYASNPIELDNNTGVVDKNYGSTTATFADYLFRRAPGFFDVVAYAGTSSSTTPINHNLGVKPELIIAKARNSTGSWEIYSSYLNGGVESYKYRLFLEGTNAIMGPSNNYWYQEPTDSAFYASQNGNMNNAGSNYITYLFATVPGISKVGSYTGTGSNLTIDCGFSSGARFVLIKCITLSGTSADWYVWDSERGITASVDPYLRLNETSAQVSTASLDIAPDNSGFTIVGTNLNINGSGEEFIFLAIA